jgi:hypothetical protein
MDRQQVIQTYAGRQETVKRLDPKDGQLNKWAKQIWLQAMTEAKVSIQTLITTKLTLCLDAAWEKILAQTEAQGTELTGEFYTNVLGKCEDPDRWEKFFMDPGVTQEADWKTHNLVAQLFRRTTDVIDGKLLTTHQDYRVTIDPATLKQPKGAREAIDRQLREDRQQLKNAIGKIDQAGNTYYQKLHSELFGSEGKAATYRALYDQWNTSEAGTEITIGWYKAHRLLDTLRRHLQSTKSQTLFKCFKDMASLEHEKGKIAPTQIWAKIQRYTDQMRQQGLDFGKTLQLDFFKQLLLPGEEARWALVSTTDGVKAEDVIGTLDIVNEEGRLRRQQGLHTQSGGPHHNSRGPTNGHGRGYYAQHQRPQVHTRQIPQRPGFGGRPLPNTQMKIETGGIKRPGEPIQNSNNKVQAVEMCSFCGKTGHSKTECWTANPHLAPKGKLATPANGTPRSVRVAATAVSFQEDVNTGGNAEQAWQDVEQGEQYDQRYYDGKEQVEMIGGEDSEQDY